MAATRCIFRSLAKNLDIQFELAHDLLEKGSSFGPRLKQDPEAVGAGAGKGDPRKASPRTDVDTRSGGQRIEKRE